MSKNLSKTVRNSKATKPTKTSIKASKQLFETYERGYYVLQDGKVWKQIVDGKDNVKGKA